MGLQPPHEANNATHFRQGTQLQRPTTIFSKSTPETLLICFATT